MHGEAISSDVCATFFPPSFFFSHVFFFFLACLPSAGPCIYITLGILGIILWASMDAECDDMYSETYGMLFVVFKIQVRCFG